MNGHLVVHHLCYTQCLANPRVCPLEHEENAGSFVTLSAASETRPMMGHHLAPLKPDSNQTLTLVSIALNVAAMEAPLSRPLLLPKCPQ